MANVTSELIGIKSLLASLWVFLDKPMELYCDNQAALYIVKNPVFYKWTKHIEIDCHFIRERIIGGDIKTDYVPSKYQVADIFTKPLGKQQFQFLKGKLGIVNPHAPTWGGVLGNSLCITLCIGNNLCITLCTGNNLRIISCIILLIFDHD